jgi:hypothetical protein
MASTNLAALWPLFDEEDEDYDEYDGATSSGGPPPAVTFPTTPLNFRIQIALTPDPARPPNEWGWTDITNYVRWNPGIASTHGRQDEGDTVEAGSGALTLDNTDGRFSRRNPYGPYYGYLTRNTPIWVQADPGSGFVTLLEHYVNEWPSRWDQSRNDVTVPIVTAGILRRLRQGSVLKSPLRRSVGGIAAGDYVPYQYWPLEDGSDAEFAASALAGGAVLSQSGAVTWANDSDLTGSQPLPLLGAGTSLAATIPAYTATSRFVFQFVHKLSSAPSATVPLVEIGMTGSYYGKYVISATTDAGGSIFIDSYLPDGSADAGAGTSVASSSWGSWRMITATVYLGEGDFLGQLIFGVGETDGRGSDPGLGDNQVTTTQIGTVSTIRLIGAAGSYFGHAALFTDPNFNVTDDTLDNAEAMYGYTGEQAHVRIGRICREEAIPFTTACGSSVAVGPQPLAIALDVLRECEQADLGSLYESGFGLGYQGHSERDNAPIAMTLDMNLGHVATPPEPTDDDQGLVNRFVASRPGGSEATYEKATGPNSTAAGGPGLYEGSAQFNVAEDVQLYAEASARVLRGTIDEDRWPLIHSNLAATPDLIATWTAMRPFGARINITHPPSQMAPDTIDAFIDGYGQQFNPIDWDIGLNTSPGSPHRTFELAGPTGDTNPYAGYLVPTTCVLAEDLDTTETGVDITTDPLWSTTADDWNLAPIITIDGEDMSVSAVSGASNPQTLTVTRSVNSVVRTHAAGATVEFKAPGYLAL